MIAEYLNKLSNQIEKEEEESADKENSAPCVVCGSTDYINLYRNVVGEIEGSMTGYFSLFGGSVSGYISGSTRTLPVLSCRKCNNEKEVVTWNYTHEKDLFWSDMHNFYFMFEGYSARGIKQIYLDNPVETRNYMLENQNWKYDFYNKMTNWSTEKWAKAGFKIEKIKVPFMLFWERERYPTWSELSQSIN